MQGCFISNIQYGDLNYADSSMVQVTLTLRYDHAVHTLGDTTDDLLSGEKRGAGTGATQ